ncbi:unnamed protein product [Moneuplotes crassus]|uniref:MULE transposase domain-containing protein n=1 Tax=Euplotes crassus TaxID=5936 RepID=A0AAD2D9A6_EUPCR|nr:unnamed protein product [Moneuplotes crassus]
MQMKSKNADKPDPEPQKETLQGIFNSVAPLTEVSSNLPAPSAKKDPTKKRIEKQVEKVLEDFKQKKDQHFQRSSVQAQQERLENTKDMLQKELSFIKDPNQIQITIYYLRQRNPVKDIPETLEEMNQIILQNIRSSSGVPITLDDLSMYYYDNDKDRCLIENQEDLEVAYQLAKKAKPQHLKIILNIKRGLKKKENKCNDSSEDDDAYKGNHDQKHDSDSTDSEDATNEIFCLKECLKRTERIMRDGYCYWSLSPIKASMINKRQHLKLFRCEEYSRKKCQGTWATNPLLFNGEYGKLVCNHNIPHGEHKSITSQTVVEKYAKTLGVSSCGSDQIIDKQEVLQLIEHLAMQDISLTTNQIIPVIKRMFPNAEMVSKRQIAARLTRVRGTKVNASWQPAQYYVNCIKTYRNTPFARNNSMSLIDGMTKHFLYFYSDFQEKVIYEVRDDPNLHIFFDGTFKCCPKIWSQLFNICVFHRGKNLYIPVVHVLMQTEKYEGYKTVFKWFQNIFNLRPKFVTCDFELSLIRCMKETYPDAMIVPCFFHFAKCLWTNGAKCGLRKTNMLPLTKQLMFSLKGLAFRRSASVYRRFEWLKENCIKKCSNFKAFFEYFEHTWMDGIFKIQDWNYHDKIQHFEDLAVTNNGLESFHQMIKSQLRRIKPNFAGLVDILCQVEMLKKQAYDEDKINGNQEFNRCWPSSTIFRELYSKEKANEEAEEDKDHSKESASELLNKNPCPDYGLKDLEQLKKKNPNLYKEKLKSQERDINFLFEDFDEEASLLKTDLGMIKYNKLTKELHDNKSVDPDDSNSKGIMYDYFTKNHSSMIKQFKSLEQFKPTTITYGEGPITEEFLLQIKEDENQLQEFLDGDSKFTPAPRRPYTDHKI